MPIRVARRRNSSSPPSVYERLKQLILDQKVAPGAPLPEEELARTFGVSRTPIHEALVRLEKDRLVVLQPWRGAFVRGMTMDDVGELYQIREALEGLTARLAAETMTLGQVAELERNVETMQACDPAATPRSSMGPPGSSTGFSSTGWPISAPARSWPTSATSSPPRGGTWWGVPPRWRPTSTTMPPSSRRSGDGNRAEQRS